MNEREFRVLFTRLGISFSEVDRKYNLPRNTTRLAITMPNTKGEKALAEVLGRSLSFLFPTRYEKNDKRLKPQPTYQYYVVKTLDCDLSAFSKEDMDEIIHRFYELSIQESQRAKFYA